MRELLLMITAVSLFVGCSSKDEKSFLHIYEKNKEYHLQLQKTEKTQLYDAGSTKAMMTATYLFEEISDLNDTRDEKFIIGLNIEDEEDHSFVEGDYNLTLAGKAPNHIETLKQSDSRLKNISFVSEWSQFYFVTFPHTKSKSFSLIFQSEIYGKGKLHFAKVAKFVLSKEAF